MRLHEAQVSTVQIHRSLVGEACVRILSLRRTVARSVETRGCGATTRGQMSCEARACRRWRHLIAVYTSTDLIEASTEPAINSLDAQKCGAIGMTANTQVKRHVCEVSGSTAVCLQRNVKAMARGT